MAYFDLEEYGNFAVVRFFLHEISLEYLSELGPQLEGMLPAVSGDIILDMGEVEAVEGSVVQFLARFQRLCLDRGHRMALAAVSPRVMHVVNDAQPRVNLRIYGTLEEAFEKLPLEQETLEASASPASGQTLLCDRVDCVFNRTSGHDALRHFCTHDYAQMIGNPRNCKYFRLNWMETSEETQDLLDRFSQPHTGPERRYTSPSGYSGPERRGERPAPEPPPAETRQAEPSARPSTPPPSRPAPAAAPQEAAAPAEKPQFVVKRYIESWNQMDFEAEAACLAPDMLNGSRQQYVARRKTVFDNLAQAGMVPQYYFLRLNRQSMGDDDAEVDCMRAEVDSVGRREVRQQFALRRYGDEWKITSVTSGGGGRR